MKPQLKNSIWIAIASAIVLILVLVVAAPHVSRIILSVPLVLFLPGFVLTLILFPPKSLDIPTRLLLSVGLSVAFTAVFGLVLNLTPWGLQAKTLWIVLLLSLAVEIAVILFVRRNWWRDSISFPAGLNFNTRQWVLMALAALMTIMAIRIAGTPTSQQGLEGYTMLWLKPGNTSDAIRVGVESEEFKLTGYQIKYQYNGGVHQGSSFQLEPGETWERSVQLPSDVEKGTSVTVLLYRLDNPTDVYRQVIWWPESQ